MMLAQLPARLAALLVVVVSLFVLVSPAAAQIPGLDLSGGGEQSAEEGEGAQGTVDLEVEAALAQLAEVLQDEGAREAFLARLRQSDALGEADTEAASEEEASPIGQDLRSLGGDVADWTGGAVAGTAATLRNLVQQIVGLPAIFVGLSAQDLGFLGWLAANLAVLVVVTYGGLWLMARVTDRLRRRLRVTIRHEGALAKIFAVLATLAIDFVRALVPWGLGYLVALSVLATPGQLAYHHALYLNAFLVLELGMAVLRTLMAPNRDEARMVTLKSHQAHAVMRWTRLIASVLIYAQLVLLPLVTRHVSAVSGRVMAVLGLAVVLILLGAAILRMRLFVAKRLVRFIGISKGKRVLRSMARYWHVPVLLYLLILFFVALSRPLDGFYSVIFANAQIAVVILVAILVSNMVTRLIGKGVTLPQSWRDNVPLLEARLNSFVPKALWVLRALIILVAVFYCLHLLGAFDSLAFLESEFGAWLTGATITILLILFFGFGAWLLLNSWIDYRINPDSPAAVSARERTLLVLMRNALTIALVVIILMFVLSEVGINIAPLLASAGVIGLAIGFGAQKLVQDIITGVFIQLEGAIDVGDVVAIGGISGVVERLTVRSAGLRDLEGNYHLIPFSSVDIVTNYMRGYSFALIDMGIAYREDIEEAKTAMYDAFNELKADPEQGHYVTGDFEWFGLNAFGASEVVLRARIKTLPGNQWGVRRAYNAIIKRIFDERGIEIPFPHQTLYFGEDKAGKAPPIHMVRDDRLMPESGDAPGQTRPADMATHDRRTDAGAEDTQGQRMPDVDEGPDGPGGDR